MQKRQQEAGEEIMHEITYNFISIADGKKRQMKKVCKYKFLTKLEAWLLKTQIGVFDVEIK